MYRYTKGSLVDVGSHFKSPSSDLYPSPNIYRLIYSFMTSDVAIQCIIGSIIIGRDCFSSQLFAVSSISRK